MHVLYLIFLIVLLIAYVGIISLFRFFKNQTITNLIFFLIIYVFYVFEVVYMYFKAGLNDWNFQNTLPYANVSPFIFGTLPLFYMLPKPAKKYYKNLLSLLSLGMLISMTASMIFNFSRQYSFHITFMMGYVGHMAMSLWGIYFAYTKQVELKPIQSLISGSFIVAVAIIMMILNVILDKSFFGLSLNGKHNIYNTVLVSNSYLSALIYFWGLCTVMFVCYFYQKLIYKLTAKKEVPND